ncbi:MAG: DUF4157 domain-containing protein [Myxococcales bacterium]|nr:DUF4157 domain-containing protein [Myxococcales bacterium]
MHTTRTEKQAGSIARSGAERKKEGEHAEPGTERFEMSGGDDGPGERRSAMPVTPAITDVLNDWAALPPASDNSTPRADGRGPIARHEGSGAEPTPALAQPYAQLGLQGGRTSLPYRSELERGFGRSLADIPVFAGPTAQRAADALNAEAYSVGGSIVLGRSQDKHTVAEETAHALQFRSGGLGAASGVLDPSSAPEIQARSAADVVVSGGRASELSQGLSGGAVARKKKGDSLQKEKESNKVPKGQGSVGRDRLANDDRMSPGDFDKMQGSRKEQASALAPDQKSAHARGQSLLYDQTITQGQTVEQAGNDGAHQLSKVLPSAGGLLAGTYGFSAGGSIGHAETTAGRSASDTKEILGLDYDTSPFLNDSHDPSQGFKDGGVTYIQFGMTDQMKEQARVSMSPEMIDHVHQMQQDSNEALNGPLNAMQMLNYNDAKGGAAFKGTGGTATSDQYGSATTTVNQELTFGKGEGRDEKTYLPLPDGTKMMFRDKAGEDRMVAELQTNKEGEQEWQYNMGLVDQDPATLLDHMGQELSTLNENVQKANDAVIDFTKKQTELDKDLQTKSKSVPRLEGEVTSAEAKLKEAEKGGGDTGRLQTDLNAKKQQLTSTKQAVETLEKDKQDLATKLQKANEKLKEWTEKLQKRKPQLETGMKQCEAKLKAKAGGGK